MMHLAWLLCAASATQSETVAIGETPYRFEIVKVPGGRSRIGSAPDEPGRDPAEGPAREVDLVPFWMARTEVTWEAFAEFFERRERSRVDGITRPSSPYEPPNGEMGTGKHSAVGMRWHTAVGYCLWLSKRTGQKFRLPTEAEWEHAARAGASGPRPDKLLDVAWVAENSGRKTHVVGTRAPNAFGLYDMIGNVWEYCLEPFQPGEYNPVLRGGAWDTPASAVRFARRQRVLGEWYSRDPNRPRSLWWLTDARFVGFRVVRMGEAGAQEAQAAYLPRVEVRGLSRGEPQKGFVPVSGEVVNAGDRTLWEVELLVFHADAAGKPVFEDLKARPTFNVAYPVLVNSFHPGPHAQPLAPGEARRFTVLVPEPFDIDEVPEQVGARVTGVRLAD
jgi:formylglycine-generating enzyme required for sulfatase activity